MPTSSALHRPIAWTFLVLAAVVFLSRGPYRSLKGSDDLAPPYGGARAWLLGRDPYDAESVGRILVAAGREAGPRGDVRFNPSLYPPPSFLVMAPIAAMRWEAARLVFLLGTLALFACHLPALVRLAGLGREDTLTIALVGGTVALAPYHTGIALGQVAIPSVTLLVIACDRIARGRSRAGGLALALATLFKPQIAAPFIIYFLLRGQRRAAALALAIVAGAAVVGIAWMEWNGVPWLASWRETTAGTQQPGGHHDPTGPWSAQLLELRPLLALVLDRDVGLIGALIASALGLWLFIAGRRLDADSELLLLSAVAVVTTMAVYHRFYDAAVLCLPLAWAARELRKGTDPRRHALIAAGCCALFFVPGAWMLQRWAVGGQVPPEWTRTTLWNGLLLRHQNWALVALFVVLMAAVLGTRNRLRTRASVLESAAAG